MTTNARKKDSIMKGIFYKGLFCKDSILTLFFISLLNILIVNDYYNFNFTSHAKNVFYVTFSRHKNGVKIQLNTKTLSVHVTKVNGKVVHHLVIPRVINGGVHDVIVQEDLDY